MKSQRKLLQVVDLRVRQALLRRHRAFELVHPFPGETRTEPVREAVDFVSELGLAKP